MIRQNYRVLTPAYGRDYRSAKDAKADFLAGRDWVLQPDQAYCSKTDFAPGVVVNLRFAKATKVTPCKVA